MENKKVWVSHGQGKEHHEHELNYTHLVLALGSITNFFNTPGLAERAVTMKLLGDAIYLRNRLISNLEEADFECFPDERAPVVSMTEEEILSPPPRKMPVTAATVADRAKIL